MSPWLNLANCDALRAHELSFELWFPVFQQHLDYLAEVRLQLIERSGLSVRARKAGDVANQQVGYRIALNHCGVIFHGGRSLL